MDPALAQKILKKTKEDYQELAEEFSQTRIYPWKDLENLLKYVKEGDRVLDLGCGNGRLYKLLHDKQIEYVGVDSSEKLIKIAKVKFEIRNSKSEIPISSRILDGFAIGTNSKFKIQNSKFDFLVADALNLPFAENSFCIVFAIALLHQIPSEEFRQKVIKEAKRVLKNKGILILTVWNFFQPKLLLKYKIWPMIFGKTWQEMDRQDVLIPWKLKNGRIINRYYHAFKKQELKNLVQRNGFKIKNCYYTKKGQRENWLKGYNLILIAQKYD